MRVFRKHYWLYARCVPPRGFPQHTESHQPQSRCGQEKLQRGRGLRHAVQYFNACITFTQRIMGSQSAQSKVAHNTSRDFPDFDEG